MPASDPARPTCPLRLVDARQLRAVEVAEPLPDLRERQAGEFLVQRVDAPPA